MSEKDRLEIGNSICREELWTMKVDTKWFRHLLDGSKTIEVRKNGPERWGRVKKGDLLHLENEEHNAEIRFRVKDVRTYSSLDAMLATEGLRNVLPGVKTLEDAKRIYNTIDGTSMNSVLKRMEEYEKYGLIAIELGVNVAYW